MDISNCRQDNSYCFQKSGSVITSNLKQLIFSYLFEMLPKPTPKIVCLRMEFTPLRRCICVKVIFYNHLIHRATHLVIENSLPCPMALEINQCRLEHSFRSCIKEQGQTKVNKIICTRYISREMYLSCYELKYFQFFLPTQVCWIYLPLTLKAYSCSHKIVTVVQTFGPSVSICQDLQKLSKCRRNRIPFKMLMAFKLRHTL